MCIHSHTAPTLYLLTDYDMQFKEIIKKVGGEREREREKSELWTNIRRMPLNVLKHNLFSSLSPSVVPYSNFSRSPTLCLIFTIFSLTSPLHYHYIALSALYLNLPLFHHCYFYRYGIDSFKVSTYHNYWYSR